MIRKTLLAVSLLLTLSAQARDDDSSPLGTATRSDGVVLYAATGAGLSPQPLQAGARLAPGAVLRTGKQGHAWLTLDNGSRILLLPKSEAKLNRDDEEMGGSLLSLYAGTILVSSALKEGVSFTVDSGKATLVASSAQWQVQCGKNGTKVSVLNGSLHLRIAGVLNPVKVMAGQKALAVTGQGKSVPLEAKELRTLKRAFQDPIFEAKTRKML